MDFLSSYLSPGSLQYLEVAGQGRYLFPKSPYTRSATKQLMGLSFWYTRKQKIRLSLKRMSGKSPLLLFPLRCHRSCIGDSAPVNCSRQRRHLLPHKLEILKDQSLLFPFMLKQHIDCSVSPATGQDKMLQNKMLSVMYLPFRINPVSRASVGTTTPLLQWFNLLLLGEENYM